MFLSQCCGGNSDTFVCRLPICNRFLGLLQVFFRIKLILADLTPQSAILGWYQEGNFCVLKNQILLIFKIILYKYRELGRSSLNRILSKSKLVRKIENGINTNHEYNNRKWEQIKDLLE